MSDPTEQARPDEREELRERIAQALSAHGQAQPIGFREGDHDPDAECPWGMREMDWPGFADAVLDALGLEQVHWSEHHGGYLYRLSGEASND